MNLGPAVRFYKSYVSFFGMLSTVHCSSPMRDREDTARSRGDSDVRRRDDRDDRRRERERLPGRLRSQGVCTCLFPDRSYASSKLQSAPVGKLPDEENATLDGMEDDRFPGRLKEGSVFSTTSPLMPVLLLKTYLGLLGTVDYGPTGLAPLERKCSHRPCC